MRAPGLVFGISLLCGLVCSQAPEFEQQYLQRLGGAVDELSLVVQHFDEDSSLSGFGRTEALQVMGGNPERLVRDQARRMDGNIVRLGRLRSQQDAMGNSGSIGSFVSFVAGFDPAVAKRTLNAFVPALPFTMAGAMFALLGLLLPYLGLYAATAFGRRRQSGKARA